jgi:recombination protein RecA
VEIFGPEASGKTTVALHLIAEAQKAGGIVAFIDAEHALDPVYARNLGVNIDELYISQPDDGEQALDIADEMVRSGAIDVIVIDSVAALVPRAEIEGDMGDSHMGLHARLMSQALRKLTALSNKNNCIILFTNQLREKIGAYGNPETTTGGRALKFYASVRLDIRRVSKGEIKQGENHIGFRTKVKVVKNKVAPPFKTCEFDIIFGQGIAMGSDILDLAADVGVVNKSGSWFSYNDIRLGQGRTNANAYLMENPDLMAEIERAVREHYGMPVIGAVINEPAVSDEKPAKKASKKSAKKAADDIVATLDMDDDEINSIIQGMGLEEEGSGE